jgi:hypothetical protein
MISFRGMIGITGRKTVITPICAVIQTNLSAANPRVRTAISLDLRVTTVVALKVTRVMVLTMKRVLVLKTITRVMALKMMRDMVLTDKRVLVLKVRRVTSQTMNNQTKIIDLIT